jgi:hypothetical protein
MTGRPKAWLATALLLGSIGCQRDAAKEPPADAGATAEQGAATRDAGAMGGMGAMPGAAGSGMELGNQMMTQLQGMQAMHGDSLMQAVPLHRQMLGNMMGQMDREMQSMNMGADAKWTALRDSLSGDLTRMAQMSATEMQAFMPAHGDRATRLMDMHGAMMGGMAK